MPKQDYDERELPVRIEADAGAESGETQETPGTEAEGPDAEVDVDALRRERDEYYDRLLRKTAEFDNFRKRTDRERREQAELAAADLIEDLLPIIDDFERALRAEPTEEGTDSYRRGVELIHRQLLELLRRRGVTPIATVGEMFDPHLHQAVVQEHSPEHRDGEVLEEFRRGYKLGDRLLRPAMVKVAKA